MSVTESNTPLRGPEVAPPSRKLGIWLLVGCAAILIGISVATLATAIGNASHVARMKSHGVQVTATVSTCRGNLGGSGSNLASYTCYATYSVRGQRYESVVGGMSTFAPAGRPISVVADPEDFAAIETTALVKSAQAGPVAFAIPALLFVLGIGCVVLVVMMSRREAPGSAAVSER